MLCPIVLVQWLNSSVLWADAIDFAHDVVPILKKHCVECHGGVEAKGGFSLNTRELFLDADAASVGAAAESHFLQLVESDDADLQMPPAERPRVGAEEISILIRWVDEGLTWEEGFTFAESTYEPPLLPRVVTLPQGSEGANPIDLLLAVYLKDRNLPSPSMADDEVFMRRVHLDLTGLLPTPEQRQVFLDDRSPSRRDALVDRLLSDDVAYAEHWLTFWNDLLRNDYEGTGFITGGRKQISEWLYRALVDNKRFDEFTRELLSPPNDQSSGFIDGIKWRGAVSAGQTLEIQFAQSVAQSFLGINLKCASCHDSFIDRWKLTDAYSLAAVYASDSLEIARCDKPTGQVATAGWLYPELGNVDASAPRDVRLEQLAALVTHRDNGRYARTIVNRLWAQMMGRGLVHPLDSMNSEPWYEDLLDLLANELVENNYDLKQMLRLIATSNAYGSETEVLTKDPETETEYVYAGPRAKRMTAEQFVDAIWQMTRSAPIQFDAPLLRGKVDPEKVATIELKGSWIWGPSAAKGSSPPAGEELTFRKVIQLEKDPISGVAVISADNGFDLFINNRRIASSDDWTQPHVVPLAGILTKGDNTIVLVGRNAGVKPNPAGVFFQAQIGFGAESQMAVYSDESWEYSRKIPPSKEGRLGGLQGPWDKITVYDGASVYSPIHGKLRRGLAMVLDGDTRMVRASLLKSDFLMRSLGRPNRDQIVTSRPSELTTLEAIDLANGGTLSECLRIGAEQIQSESLSPHQIGNRVYEQAFTRLPTPTESELILDMLGKQPSVESIQDLLWAVATTPEFMMVR